MKSGNDLATKELNEGEAAVCLTAFTKHQAEQKALMRTEFELDERRAQPLRVPTPGADAAPEPGKSIDKRKRAPKKNA